MPFCSCVVEWCCTEDFKPVVGDFIMTDLRSMEYIIPDLDKVQYVHTCITFLFFVLMCSATH